MQIKQNDEIQTEIQARFDEIEDEVGVGSMDFESKELESEEEFSTYEPSSEDFPPQTPPKEYIPPITTPSIQKLEYDLNFEHREQPIEREINIIREPDLNHTNQGVNNHIELKPVVQNPMNREFNTQERLINREPVIVREPIITREPVILREPIKTREPIIIREPEIIRNPEVNNQEERNHINQRIMNSERNFFHLNGPSRMNGNSSIKNNLVAISNSTKQKNSLTAAKLIPLWLFCGLLWMYSFINNPNV